LEGTGQLHKDMNKRDIPALSYFFGSMMLDFARNHAWLSMQKEKSNG